MAGDTPGSPLLDGRKLGEGSPSRALPALPSPSRPSFSYRLPTFPRTISICQLAGGASEEETIAHKRIQRKLIAALCLAFVFMIVEVVGGVMAHSLAIITDAAHLLSDVSGFAVAVVAAVWAKRKSQEHFSYGYHRVEVLGALASVMTVWLVTGLLLFEAIQRIITPEPVNGKLMFIIAVLGVGVNVVMLAILGHNHGPGSSCSHSHEGGAGHQQEEHGHSHGPGSSCSGHARGGSKAVAKRQLGSVLEAAEMSSSPSQRAEEGACCHHDHAEGSHKHSHSHAAAGEEDLEVGRQGSGAGQIHAHHHGSEGHECQEEESRHHQHSHRCHSSEEEEEEEDRPSHHSTSGRTPILQAGAPSSHHACQDHDHSHHNNSSSGGGGGSGGATALAPAAAAASSGGHGGHNHSNMNMRGAIIHVIGDFVQSIGVAVAGLLIWLNQDDPRWYIADPICTFLFAALVLWTTCAILRDIGDVLMERVPRGLCIKTIHDDLSRVAGVESVSDLHVWSLTPGIPLLCAHVNVSPEADPTDVLHALTSHCRSLDIQHSTIQLMCCGAECEVC